MKCPKCGSGDTRAQYSNITQTADVECECCGRKTNIVAMRIGKKSKEEYVTDALNMIGELSIIMVVSKGLTIGKTAIIVSDLIRHNCVYEGIIMEFEIGKNDGKIVPIIYILVCKSNDDMPKK